MSIFEKYKQSDQLSQDVFEIEKDLFFNACTSESIVSIIHNTYSLIVCVGVNNVSCVSMFFLILRIIRIYLCVIFYKSKNDDNRNDLFENHQFVINILICKKYNNYYTYK